jgi:predicted Fe-Mo cluster-binding NifX family protein
MAQAVHLLLQRHMMKIAIPLFDNRISPYFDYAPATLLVRVEGGSIVERQEVNFSGWSMEQRITFCREAGVSLLVCGGITNNAHSLLESSGIRVIPWVSGEAEKALALYLKGGLEPGTMLCRGRRRRWHFCTERKKKEA